MIFGAKGIVTQDTQEATVGVLGANDPGDREPGRTSPPAEATLTCSGGTQCFTTSEVGMLVQDSYGFLGAGTTIVSVDPSLTFVTLSRNALNAASVNTLPVTLTKVQTVVGATLTSDTPTAGVSTLKLSSCTASSCFTASDVGLLAFATGADIPAGTVIATYARRSRSSCPPTRSATRT